MHAITYKNYGAPDVLEWAEHPTPEPSARDVLIRVRAAGINRADIMQRQGKYPPPKGTSDILGMEVAGEIAALGSDVTRWKIGDKVCALVSGGGYAEYTVAPEGQCLPIPSGLSMVEAAVLPEAIVTVFANLFETAQLKSGETVLVHGGASGIGTTAIQMVKLFGAKIFVTAASPEKCEACLKRGADLAIDYKSEDFVEVIQRATSGQGIDIVLDMGGGDYVARNLVVLAPFGRHISIATQRNVMANVDIRQIMQKRLILTGSTLRGRSGEEKARLVGEAEIKIWPWVVRSTLKPLIYKTYPIKHASLAHKMMESGAHIGKIALEVGV